MITPGCKKRVENRAFKFPASVAREEGLGMNMKSAKLLRMSCLKGESYKERWGDESRR